MKNQIKVDIITIGDEILIGQIVDTNSSFIAKELNKIGFSIAHMVSVADRKEEIQLALEESFSKSNLILITGGLGPTKDDITKKVLSDFFEMHLVFDPSVFTDVENGSASCITSIFFRRGMPGRQRPGHFPGVPGCPGGGGKSQGLCRKLWDRGKPL